MGQTIEILETVVMGEVALIDTDRSLGGQDGESFSDLQAAQAGHTFPAGLAARLFAAEPGLASVYILSNTVSLRRPGGWEAEAVEDVEQLISRFFRFYADSDKEQGEAPEEETDEPVGETGG